MQCCTDDLVRDVQDNMTSSADTSSELVEDVKVCDTCGDIGEEEKLVVCSRCNDGAEHTYCMNVMIEDVPAGEWFCEECQVGVDIEKKKKKLEISQVKAGTISSEHKAEAEHVGNKESNKACQCNGISSKRKEDAGILCKHEKRTCNVCFAPCSSCAHRDCHSFSVESEVGCVTSGLTSTIKVEDGGSCIGGSEAVSKDKSCHDYQHISINRSTAFNLKSLDVERHILKSQNYDVSCNFEVKDTSSVVAINGRIKTRSEVKICNICGDVGEEKKLAVCCRCNDGAEHIYCMRVMIEEVPDVGWLCEMCQSEVETEKKNNKLEKSGVKIGTSKGQSVEGKLNKPANGANIISSSKSDMEITYEGGEDSKRGNHDNCTATQRKEAEAGVTSSVTKNLPEPGGLSIEGESRKRVLLSGSSSFKFDLEKAKHATGQVPTSLASNALKNKMQPIHGLLSKSVSFNSSKIPKVKQLGSEVPLKPKHLKKPSSYTMKQVDPMNTATSPKAMTLIKPLADETRVMNPPMSRNVQNNIGTSILGCPSVNASMSAPVPSLPESSGHSELKKSLLAKAPGSVTLSSVERSTGILVPDVHRKAVQIPYPSSDTVCTVGTSVDSPTMSSDLWDKALSSQDFLPGYEQIPSTAPELNYIWQGGFELWRTGRSPELCDGLQAHISFSASPKLLEVAKKFPSKIQLEVLPRWSVWPSQFQKTCPTYDSIGLYFFARDTQSYENYYSRLVESTMKDDLALRGNIETAELLIFASSTLSKNFQRWNMLYFLWGVFRFRREDILNLPREVPELAISAHQDELLGSSSTNDGEVTFDVSTAPVPCANSTFHEGNESTTIKLKDTEDLMDVDHEVITGIVEPISRTSDGARKRNVEMTNWADKSSETRERKRIKLDGGGPGNNELQAK